MKSSDQLLTIIAQRYHVSIQEVRKDMEEAIAQCYQHPNPYAQAIPRKRNIPTIEEFIAYVSAQIRHNT